MKKGENAGGGGGGGGGRGAQNNLINWPVIRQYVFYDSIIGEVIRPLQQW